VIFKDIDIEEQLSRALDATLSEGSRFVYFFRSSCLGSGIPRLILIRYLNTLARML